MLIKHPYELSAWVERLENGIKVEKKGVIIGAHDMTYIGKATNIKLKTVTKGTHTLTFEMPSKYFDSELGDYVHNELVDTLMAETKIKLSYKDKWYEFFIKKITENKKFKAIMYSYSCQDSFIDELSRTGYELEFAPELNNSVAESGDFMEEILEESTWDYTPQYNTGDFTEYNEQKFYRIPLKQFGGKISGYKINLEVTREMFLDNNNQPKSYLKNKLDIENKVWNTMTKEEQNNFIDELMTITNVFTNQTRELEYGDDLARKREIFWDCYYKDNGAALLSKDNRYTLEGDYIYVPITDLSMILGSVYEDAYSAIEEPAIYGSYPDTSYGYALQPTSLNPRGLIQFIFLKDGDIFHIDESGVLSDNDFHYVIPIEDWNNILKERLNEGGLIYWSAPLDSGENALKTNKYSYADDGVNIYTTNARPNSSVIDKFNWYPVYYDNYLSSINGTEVTMARKLSVTDRTEYNKASDIFVTVYQNKAEEYVTNNEDLYTEKELTNKVKEGQDFRVCSKLKTRQILPTLARNLVQNGTEITDTNGWEAKTQNNNKDEITGTGSYKSLMQLEVHPTLDLDASDTLSSQDLTGTYQDEIVSDYYLKVISPKLNRCIDFSKEGTTESDYVLNFGLISQDYKIEKDKVYAIRIKTGNMITKKAEFLYRSGKVNHTNIEKDINKAVKKYMNTMDNYYSMITAFSRAEEKAMNIIKKLINTASEPDEVKLFYTMINKLNQGKDDSKMAKLKAEIDQSLAAILFGGNWSFDGVKKTLTGLINLYDQNKNQPYEKFINIAIQPQTTTTNTILSNISYKNSDISYLKYYLYTKVSTISAKELSTVSGLTKAIENSWKNNYIKYDKEFNELVNEDLDKIIIGKGCLDSNGNYVVEGIDSGNEYISFKDVFDIENSLYYVPNNKVDNSVNSLNNKEKLTTQIYHNKIGNTWSYSKEKGSAISIDDDVFLLFKANQTIENPYVGLKVTSAPMKINFDNIEKTTYSESTSSGVVINVKKKSAQEYLNNIKIDLVRIDKRSVSEKLQKTIGLDEKKGTFNTELSSFEYNDTDLKTNHITWSGISSVENPVIDSAFLLSNNEKQTVPYLVFLDGKCAGLIYLKKKEG